MQRFYGGYGLLFHNSLRRDCCPSSPRLRCQYLLVIPGHVSEGTRRDLKGCIMCAARRRLVERSSKNSLFHDRSARKMLQLSYDESEYERGDVTINETTADSIELGDGTLSNHKLIIDGKMLLQICDECRRESKRSRHANPIPMSPAARTKRCISCQAAICSRHYITSRIDEQVRCKRCHRWHMLKHFIVSYVLRPLFFRRIVK